MKKNLSRALDQAAAHHDINKSAAHPQIETEPFKKWFGDSRVVDADGKPLVVHHGSPNKKGQPAFGEKGNLVASIPSDGVFFVTPSHSYAHDFARGGRVEALYARIENPVDLTDSETLDRLLLVFNSDAQIIATRGPWIEDEEGDIGESAYFLLESKNVIRTLKSEGFDGAFIDEDVAQYVQSFAVFSPNQIKSATSNNGNFDPANNSITDQGELPAVAAYLGDLATPQTSRVQEKNNWQAWFGNSKIVDDQGKALAVYRGSRSDEGEDIGRYFTDSREIASSFSGATKTQVQGVVYPVYLSMQNPCLLQTGDTKIGLEKRALAKGHDGWIAEYRGVREFYIFSANQARSAIGKNADFNLFEKDIEKSADQPQTKTEPFKKWFGSSKVLDEKSQPLVLFHSTYSDFTVPIVNFGQDEWKRFGMHVGSLDAATSRLDLKDREDRSSGERSGNAGANIMPVYVSIKNPLRLTENRSGRWGVDDIFGAIVRQAEAGDPALNWISPEFIDDFYSDANVLDGTAGDRNSGADGDAKIWQSPGDWDAGQRSRALVEWLATAGIDGIVYKNEFEGGGDSHIIFNAAQIKSALGNSGLYLRDSSSLTDHGAVLTLANAAAAKSHINGVVACEAGSRAKKVKP